MAASFGTEEECSVCFETTPSHRILLCGHHFCSDCLRQIRDHSQVAHSIKCPLCQHISDLTIDNNINSLPEYHHQIVENSQSRGHRSPQSVTEPILSPSRIDYCPLHPDYLVSSFCYDCRGNYCAECILDNHLGHFLEDIEHVTINSPPHSRSNGRGRFREEREESRVRANRNALAPAGHEATRIIKSLVILVFAILLMYIAFSFFKMVYVFIHAILPVLNVFWNVLIVFPMRFVSVFVSASAFVIHKIWYYLVKVIYIILYIGLYGLTTILLMFAVNGYLTHEI